MPFVIVIASFVIALCSFSAQTLAQNIDSRRSSVVLANPQLLDNLGALIVDEDTHILVANRLEPDLVKPPIRWHGFSFNPEIQSEQRIDSNILASPTDEQADTITVIRPSLSISKEWGRHNANLSLEGEGVKFWSNQENDVANFRSQLSGVLEARRILQIPFEVSYTNAHETRSQNFSQNISEEPIGFVSMGAALGLVYQPNRFRLSAVGRYSDIAFDNGQTSSGLAFIREDDDRTSTSIEVRGSYEIAPNHRPFLSFRFGRLDFMNGAFDGTGFNGVERDSDNLGAVAGWQFNYKGLVFGNIGIGYAQRDHDDDAIQDVDTTTFTGSVDWNLTKKSTLNLGFNRSIADNNEDIQAVLLTSGQVSYDYELLHNVFLNAFIDYTRLDVSDSDREDDILSTGLGFRYDISPRFSVTGDYNYTVRDSTAIDLDYDRHQFMMRLATKF